MGIPEQRRAINAMRKRWLKDEARLEKLFRGPVTEDDFTNSGEMLRNIGAAIEYARRFLASRLSSNTDQ